MRHFIRLKIILLSCCFSLALLTRQAVAQTPTDAAPEASQPGGFGWQDIALIAVLVLLVLFLLYWLSSIFRALALRRRHQESLHDGQPSVDERLTSELAPMQVALLRGNIQGFYEKSRSLAMQILNSRGLIEAGSEKRANEDVVHHIQSIGVDPVFQDCVEAILHRCDAVLLKNERPDEAENRKMIDDLRTLIRMRPKASKTEPMAASGDTES